MEVGTTADFLAALEAHANSRTAGDPPSHAHRCVLGSACLLPCSSRSKRATKITQSGQQSSLLSDTLHAESLQPTGEIKNLVLQAAGELAAALGPDQAGAGRLWQPCRHKYKLVT